MSQKCSEYIGKIRNAGAQTVKAPRQTTQPKKGRSTQGTDLRTGKK